MDHWDQCPRRERKDPSLAAVLTATGYRHLRRYLSVCRVEGAAVLPYRRSKNRHRPHPEKKRNGYRRRWDHRRLAGHSLQYPVLSQVATTDPAFSGGRAIHHRKQERPHHSKKFTKF